MIKLLVGVKGTGKTKALISAVHEALDKFLSDLEKVIRDTDINVTITVSCAPEDATETMKKYL